MSPEAQRIAIAEACGWKFYPLNLPNYLNDLNAMHEAEKRLSEEQMTIYTSNLFEICDDWPKATLATAAQRAEAFLKTVGKFELE